MRNIKFSPEAWEDYQHWLTTDKKVHRRINELIKETAREPFTGMGKPEPLKGNLSPYWSRRITAADRMVYKADDNDLVIIQLRYHY